VYGDIIVHANPAAPAANKGPEQAAAHAGITDIKEGSFELEQSNWTKKGDKYIHKEQSGLTYDLTDVGDYLMPRRQLPGHTIKFSISKEVWMYQKDGKKWQMYTNDAWRPYQAATPKASRRRSVTAIPAGKPAQALLARKKAEVQRNAANALLARAKADKSVASSTTPLPKPIDEKTYFKSWTKTNGIWNCKTSYNRNCTLSDCQRYIHVDGDQNYAFDRVRKFWCTRDKVKCRDCNGNGTKKNGRKCPTCRCTGKVTLGCYTIPYAV
jgi:hypothetical protein